jgi:aspartyl-tRNA(Asn)/glutamyl-tRNA(Gln) amidotransferase subunit C
MAIDAAEVARIAELARLEIPPERRDRLARELSAVLEFAAALDRLDLAGAPADGIAAGESPLREDRPDGRRLPVEEALGGAPEAEDGFFVVPPAVEYLEP